MKWPTHNNLQFKSFYEKSPVKKLFFMYLQQYFRVTLKASLNARLIRFFLQKNST